MQVSFYLPEKYLPDAARQEAWKNNSFITLEQGGKIASAQSWIYQTWVALQQAGVPVRLTHTLPTEGILITLAGCVGQDFRPGPGVFFADIVADGLPHPGGHLHLVQNAAHARLLPRAVFMPHWPQPNLLPRDPQRGNRWETLAFFGHEINLAPELRDPAWQRHLQESLGLHLALIPAAQWHDYRTIDAVLAVRSFDRSRHLRKPATKLYNAWLAGVPLVGGTDSAYLADGEPDGDFLVARTREKLESHLRRLKEDPAFRTSLVESGRRKSASFTREATRDRWRDLIENVLPDAAARRGRTARGVCGASDRLHRIFLWRDRLR